jgi:methionine-rich copper-binding protein CopC
MIATICAVLLCPVLANAHARLRQAEPAVGSTVHAAPSEVSILFSEGVEPRFSTIVVTGPSGAAVDKHDVHTAPGEPTRLVVGLGAIAPGTYTVEWHATSVDTHKTEGKFTFTVAP